MAAGIPALKVSRDSAVVSSSGSWFHSLMLDGKKDSLAVWDSVPALVASCCST